MYQDTIGDGRSYPTGLRKNSGGKQLIVPEGKKFFDTTGEFWSFPFGHTAGTDLTKNIYVLNFLRLPTKDDGTPWPISYWKMSGKDQLTWLWVYPVGTLLGEVIFIRDESEMHVSEIRTRERYQSGWAVNSFKPFLNSKHLADAIEAANPNWTVEKKTKILRQLRGKGDMRALTRKSDAFPGVFSQAGYIDYLPKFDDKEFIRNLSKAQTFVSTYDRPWRMLDGNTSFAPSSDEAYSIMPQNNFAGLLQITDEKCQRCHQHANQALRDYESEAILYGNIWGMDQIFSFHMFDESVYSDVGDEDRKPNPKLVSAGMLKPFSREKHLETRYTQLEVPYTVHKNL